MYPFYLGIDLHLKRTYAVLMDHTGEVIDERRILNSDLQAYLQEQVPRETYAVLEATRNWAFLYDLLTEHVERVELAHPRELKAIASAAVKTDQIDAKVLTDRGTVYCGSIQNHEYQLYLVIEDIDHSRTKTKHPQTNGVCERFHRTIKEEFYDIAFHKKVYRPLDEPQADLDDWLNYYNQQRPHSGKHCNGRTPFQTFSDTKHLAKEKALDTFCFQHVKEHVFSDTFAVR